MCFLIVSKRTDKTIVLFENNFCSVNSFPTANFNMMKHIVFQVFSLLASYVFDCMPNIDSDHAFFSKSLPAGTKLNEHLPGKEYFCVFFSSGVTVCISGIQKQSELDFCFCFCVPFSKEWKKNFFERAARIGQKTAVRKKKFC